MRCELLYQRWLEFDVPAGVGGGVAPMWSWPVPLSDGRTMLTLLYRPLAVEGRSPPRTVILELSEGGDACLWGPGVGYPAPVLFYATEKDELVGLDLTKPGKVYACQADGTHLWTLEARLKMANLVAPAFFEEREGRLVWQQADGRYFGGDITAGGVENIGAVAGPRVARAEGAVHHPHTHVVGGWLYVLDFDPMARVSRYRISG